MQYPRMKTSPHFLSSDHKLGDRTAKVLLFFELTKYFCQKMTFLAEMGSFRKMEADELNFSGDSVVRKVVCPP